MSNGTNSVAPARFSHYAEPSLLLEGACAVLSTLSTGRRMVPPPVFAPLVVALDPVRERELL